MAKPKDEKMIARRVAAAKAALAREIGSWMPKERMEFLTCPMCGKDTTVKAGDSPPTRCPVLMSQTAMAPIQLLAATRVESALNDT